MQTASCFVRLLNSNGPHKNEAYKAPVTPAEVVILRVIHGDDAVVNLKPLGMDKRAHRDELERLRYEYGPKVVNDAFPGHSPTLPVRFAEIGVDGVDSAEDDEEPQKPQRAKRGKGKQQADAAVGDGDPNAADPASDAPYDPATDGQ